MRTRLKHSGYHHVTTIPTGACNVNITELARSRNYLGTLSRELVFVACAAPLSTAGGSILNGDLKLRPTGQYPGAGTVFDYRRRSGRHCPGVCIFADGPVTEPVEVKLLYYDRNPGVMYHFTVPQDTADKVMSSANTTHHHRQQHHHDDHNHNLRQQGTGADTTNTANDISHRDKNSNKHRKHEADGAPVEYRHYYHTDSEDYRRLRQRQQGFAALDTQTSRNNVVGGGGEAGAEALLKPNIIPATRDAQSPVEGQEPTRVEVALQQEAAGHSVLSPPALLPMAGIQLDQGEAVSYSQCPQERPETMEICDMGSCAKGWYYTRWSRECSPDCGKTYKTRQVYCAAEDGSTLPGERLYTEDIETTPVAVNTVLWGMTRIPTVKLTMTVIVLYISLITQPRSDLIVTNTTTKTLMTTMMMKKKIPTHPNLLIL
nr:hypothetical protein BaRGS_033762 [Batillaria attramentaria]